MLHSVNSTYPGFILSSHFLRLLKMSEGFVISFFWFCGFLIFFLCLGYFIRNGSVSGASGRGSPDSGQKLECCVPLKFNIFWLENLSMSESFIPNLCGRQKNIFPSPAEKKGCFIDICWEKICLTGVFFECLCVKA